MDCKEIDRQIPAFIEGKLDYKDLKRFIEHVDSCEDCREELTIQFLIEEGMARLEEGSAFDLQKELDNRMDAALRSIRIHRMFKYMGITLEVIAAAAIVVIFILLFT